MEVEESVSFDLLFRDYNFENTESVLPLAKKCLAVSQNETEFVRALEIVLCFSLKNYSFGDLEGELFQTACPPAKNFVLDKLQFLERDPAACFEHLAAVLKVITYFQGVFDYLSTTTGLSLLDVKSFLTATSEILYGCYSHCKNSEQVYGSLFTSATDCLSSFFKNCCSLQEQMLDFISEKSYCNAKNRREMLLLDEILIHLSKSGVILIHMDVKTMARVWKIFAGLIQRYISFLKYNHNIGETIAELSCSITASIETALSKDGEDIPKVVKLNCFLLKLIIKFCEMFNGSLKDCHEAISSLLLLLCRCSAKEGAIQEVLNQLAIGVDPLLSQLMRDELLVKECHRLSEDCEKSPEFSLLSCIILRKLIDSNKVVRKLWFGNTENILEWIFVSASFSQFFTCSNFALPRIVVKGKRKRFTDLYEHVLVTACAFSMTATSPEYALIEKTLIENVLQKHPIRALLAIDMWCLLARYADSQLCLSQIVALGKLFQELHPGTERPEKWYLGSLIRRLFPLLTESHKAAFLKDIEPSLLSGVWPGRGMNGLSRREACGVWKSLLAEVGELVVEEGGECWGVEAESEETRERLVRKVGMLWRFDCEALSSSGQRAGFLKIVCALTASVVGEMSPEVLFLVLSQMKRLIAIGQPTPVELYFTWILFALSAVTVPPGRHQRSIITAIADIFRSLLSSKEAPTKGKALETFFFFSHVTFHEEIVPLSVQNAPELKQEVADYLNRKPPEPGGGGGLEEYFRELYRMRFEHVCREEEGSSESVGKRMRTCGVDAEEVVVRWEKDARKIMECFEALSDSERDKIRGVCSSISSLL